MGKKKGGFEENDKKKESAKDRKASKERDQAAAKAKAAEDAAWAAAGDGAKSKGQKKKEDVEAKAAEQARKKAELKALQAAEEAAMIGGGKKNKQPNKVTAFERQKIKDHDAREQKQAAEAKALASKRQVSEADYARQMRLDEEINNRNENEISASGLDQAVKAMTVDPSSSDIHPEKRVKAAFNSYFEVNLPDLKMEKPGLKMNQYRDLLWKQFQKSPENPMNRVQGP